MTGRCPTSPHERFPGLASRRLPFLPGPPIRARASALPRARRARADARGHGHRLAAIRGRRRRPSSTPPRARSSSSRNVANLVPPYEPEGPHQSTSAALEFAVQSLKVRHIVVLGHGRCGGIRAALHPEAEPLSPGDFIGKWMTLLGPAAREVATCTGAGGGQTESERQTALERASIRHSVANLRSFPCVSILEDRGRLHLHGAWFDIADGRALDDGPGDRRLLPGEVKGAYIHGLTEAHGSLVVGLRLRANPTYHQANGQLVVQSDLPPGQRSHVGRISRRRNPTPRADMATAPHRLPRSSSHGYESRAKRRCTSSPSRRSRLGRCARRAPPPRPLPHCLARPRPHRLARPLPRRPLSAPAGRAWRAKRGSSPSGSGGSAR